MNKLKLFIRKNLPTILSTFACGGVIGTAYISARSQSNAIVEISHCKKEDLTNKKKAEIFVKNHIPTALIAGGTIACIITSDYKHRAHQAAMISAYGVLNELHNQYKNKVIEHHGPEEHKKILDEINAEHADPPHIYADTLISSSSLNVEDILSDETEKLFFDEYSKRWFTSTYGSVLQAQYHLNRNFVLGDVVLLNDYYSFLGLEQTMEGNELAWFMNGDYGWLDFDNRVKTTKDGTAYISISMLFEPTMEWQEDY